MSVRRNTKRINHLHNIIAEIESLRQLLVLDHEISKQRITEVESNLAALQTISSSRGPDVQRAHFKFSSGVGVPITTTSYFFDVNTSKSMPPSDFYLHAVAPFQPGTWFNDGDGLVGSSYQITVDTSLADWYFRTVESSAVSVSQAGNKSFTLIAETDVTSSVDTTESRVWTPQVECCSGTDAYTHTINNESVFKVPKGSGVVTVTILRPSIFVYTPSGSVTVNNITSDTIVEWFPRNTEKVGCILNLDTAGNILANTPIPFDSVEYDPLSMWNPGTYTLTIPEDGIYEVDFNICASDFDTFPKTFTALVIRNGAVVAKSAKYVSNLFYPEHNFYSTELHYKTLMNQGDTLNMILSLSGGSAYVDAFPGNKVTFFSIFKVD